MKKIEAIIKPWKLHEVREALERRNIKRMTVFAVKGAGSLEGTPKEYRGIAYIENAEQVKIEIIAEDDEASQVAHNIASVLRDGQLCDGEIAILPLEELIRVRVGQRSHSGPNERGDIAPTNLMRNKVNLRSYLRALRRKFQERHRGHYQRCLAAPNQRAF